MRFLIAITLLFAVTPGMSEVAEAAVHLITHADLPHQGHDDSADCDEHSCTPLSHHCGCHAPMSAQTVRTIASAKLFRDITRLELRGIEHDLGRSSEPPALRPPIA